jgi:hypothetical protein
MHRAKEIRDMLVAIYINFGTDRGDGVNVKKEARHWASHFGDDL